MSGSDSGGSLWMLVFLLAFGLPIAGIVWGNRKLAAFQPKVKPLMEAFGGALKEGKPDEAWRNYTSEKFKQKKSVEAFRSEFHELTSKFGPLTRFEVAETQSGYIIGFGLGLHAFVNLYFERYTYHLKYYVAKQPDGDARIALIEPWPQTRGSATR